MTKQILMILAEQLTATLVIAGAIFLLGLIFEKQIVAAAERLEKLYREKKKEKNKKEYVQVQLRKEADRQKVQKIRDNLNREIENTGTVYIPYYLVS